MIPANAERREIVEYGGDPAESWVLGLYRSVMDRLQGRLGQHAVVGFDGDPGSTLGGYAKSPQTFTGAASRATTNVVTRNGAYPTISSGVVSGPMGDPARRILANRLSRGQGY